MSTSRSPRILTIDGSSRPDSIEPRAFPRIDVSIEVTLTCPAGTLEGTIRNISEGGVLVFGVGVIAIGSLVTMQFRLPGDVGVVQATGIAVRSKVSTDPSSQEPPGVGITFDDIPEAALVAIRALIEERDPMPWEGGSQLPRELAVRFIPVIRRQAYRIVRRLPRHISVDDLASAGFVALVECYRRFDHSPGGSFEQFALIRIRGAMLDELRGHDPVSRGMRRLKRRVDAAATELMHGLGRQPDEVEIAGHLGLTLDDYRACLGAVSIRHQPADDILGQDSMAPVTGPNRAVVVEAPSPESAAVASETLTEVREAMEALPPRLREVLELYFGEDLTMRDIGAALGLTTARISQLVTQAVGQLRDDCCPDSERRGPRGGG